MKFRVFGRLGWSVSEIGFGAWAIGGNRHGNSYGPTKDELSLEAIAKSLEMGCNFFDTADVYGYGHSEELLGQGLKGARDKVFIATKVGGDFYGGYTRMNFSAQYIRFALEKSLERLQTPWVDLYQLHNPSLDMIEDGKAAAVLEELKKEGKIKAIGISIFEPEEGIAAMQDGRYDSIQVAFSLLRREAQRELFPLAAKQGVAIIAREPLMNGFLAGKVSMDQTFVPGDIREGWPPNYLEMLHEKVQSLRFLSRPKRTLAQAALKFVLSEKAVSTVIPGCKTPQQVEENLSACESGDFTPGDLARLAQSGVMAGT